MCSRMEKHRKFEIQSRISFEIIEIQARKMQNVLFICVKVKNIHAYELNKGEWEIGEYQTKLNVFDIRALRSICSCF